MNHSFFHLISRSLLANLSALAILAALGTSVSAEEPTSWDNGQAGERRAITIDGIEYAFHFCPAGTYTIGSPANEQGRFDDETQHNVKLSCPYWTMETQVTQKMWQEVMGDNPSVHQGDDFPVENVTWYDCQEFVKKLNEKGVAPEGWVFSLPTEAEWEIAARAGSQTPFPWGDVLNGDKANTNGTSPYGTSTQGAYLGETSAVKSYEPNAWGLYDVIGNVWEWCYDTVGDYAKTAETDPLALGGEKRGLRGGSWFYGGPYCRSANRGLRAPELKDAQWGFRCVLASAALRQSQLPRE